MWRMGAIELILETTLAAEGPVFEAFFAGFDRAFVLPDEKEGRAGFEACMALNFGPAKAALTAGYGPFQEHCVIARAGAGGDIVGGANFIALPHPPESREALVTANLNYLYINERFRSRGLFGAFLRALRGFIPALFPEAGGGPVIFIEQNDPFAMTAEAYRRDTAYAGMDQLARLGIWARQGARIVDFPYVQPPLSDSQQADDTLIYSVLGRDGPALPAALLRRHLDAFFGISVAKGAPLAEAGLAQLDRLDAMIAAGENVPLLDPAPALARLDAAMVETGFPAARFRDYARASD
jgi:hypothetical protein